MAIYRKETNPSTGTSALKQKAGLGIVDNILNKFSNHAVSNKVVAEEFERLREEIQNMSALPLLDYSNPLHTWTTSGSYTATQECYLVGTFATVSSSASEFTINGTKIGYKTNSGNAGYIAPLKLTTGDVVNVNDMSPHLHVLKKR
jgi:hypothetical protein